MRPIIATLRGPLIHTSLGLSPRHSVEVQIPRPTAEERGNPKTDFRLLPFPPGQPPVNPPPPARYLHITGDNHQGKFTCFKYGFFLASSNENSAAAHWVPWSYILSTGTRLASVIANFAPILSDHKKGPRLYYTRQPCYPIAPSGPVRGRDPTGASPPDQDRFPHDFKMAK